jgi:plastocyanin
MTNMGSIGTLSGLVAALVSLSACSNVPTAETPARQADRTAGTAAHEKSRTARAPRAPRRIDPRRGGLEIGLGEWAISPEAGAIRPGRVTFVIHNRGTMAHGFEIELEGDSSGHGSGDLFKAESRLLQPGESTRMAVTLTQPGAYKIECLVDGHDDMGMEDILEVRSDAPLQKVETRRAPGQVSISEFAFAPSEIEVHAGTEVTWRNEDPTDHTVTSTDGTFGSDSLGGGDRFSHRFDEPGVYAYRCAIHPDMQGKVRVE